MYVEYYLPLKIRTGIDFKKDTLDIVSLPF